MARCPVDQRVSPDADELDARYMCIDGCLVDSETCVVFSWNKSPPPRAKCFILPACYIDSLASRSCSRKHLYYAPESLDTAEGGVVVYRHTG